MTHPSRWHTHKHIHTLHSLQGTPMHTVVYITIVGESFREPTDAIQIKYQRGP